ncbi:MAG: hypothetical protein JNM32_02540 [Dechloromonas sp.]|nr:hypothetical protein [Dechloromonas sp.]
MKKVGFVSAVCVGLLLTSSGAMADATTICAGAAAGNGTAPGSGTAGTHFMVTGIAPKCSANVHLMGTDGTGGAWYAVGSVSAKGKNSFAGHTNGGAVAPSAACGVAGACTAGEATTARDAANTAAGST